MSIPNRLIWLTFFTFTAIMSSCKETKNNKVMTKVSIYDIEVNQIDGTTIKLESYKGKVLLIVNTASECGFTPQFEGLENLYKAYEDSGLVILGFPCNQFGEQDPGNSEEILSFCTKNYGVSFPMFEKIEVNGDNTHPLYLWLKEQKGGFLGDKIKWNFTKFLINQEGEVIKRYGSVTKPESIKKQIQKLL